MIVPSWLTWARSQIGTREIVGSEHNPVVVGYWKAGKVALHVSDDEVPWCAAFVAAALESTGYESTRNGRARSYAESAKFLTCDMRLGAVVCLSSSAGPANGHVGFLEGISDTHVALCGGNQSNAVSVAQFPKNRIVRVCWPHRAPSATSYPLAPVKVAPSATDR